MPHELFLTTRQKTEVRNAFAKNMSTKVKLNNAQLSKIIQSVGSLGRVLINMRDNLDKKTLLDLAVHLAKDIWAKLATKATSSVLDKFKR